MSDIEIVEMDVDENTRNTIEDISDDALESSGNAPCVRDPDEIIVIEGPTTEIHSTSVEEITGLRNVILNEETESSTHIANNTPSTTTGVAEATSTLVQTEVTVISVPEVSVADDASNSPGDFKEKKPSSPKKSPTKDDESEFCPICFEPWSNSGSHRLASLNCGHLFGRRCIEKWLKMKDREKCPQCNAPARRKHIRNIYAKTIKAIDTTERDNALAELEKEKLARKKAEESEAKMILQFQVARAECDRMKRQLEQQQKLMLEQEHSRQNHGKTSSVGSLSKPSSSQGHTDHKYVPQTSLQVAQSGARVMAFDRNSGAIIVSKPSPNTLFPGFGILKVSTYDTKYTQYVSIHDKAIRDAVFSNQNSSLLLTAGADKMVKITNIESNNAVASYITPAPVWSCAWNTTNEFYIYAGLQNGQCYIFDTRNTGTHLKILKREEAGGCPLVSLAFVPKDEASLFKPCGLLTCSLEGGCFWENTADTHYIPQPLHFPEGSCTCMRFEPITRHCLVSQRPSRTCNRSRHAVMQLRGEGLYQSMSRNQETNTSEGSLLSSCEIISQCYGGSSQKLLGHSALFTSPDNNSKLIACAGDEGTKSVLLWDGSTGRQLQTLQHQKETVIDVCSFEVNNTSLLATLTDQKLSLYKWK